MLHCSQMLNPFACEFLFSHWLTRAAIQSLSYFGGSSLFMSPQYLWGTSTRSVCLTSVLSFVPDQYKHGIHGRKLSSRRHPEETCRGKNSQAKVREGQFVWCALFAYSWLTSQSCSTVRIWWQPSLPVTSSVNYRRDSQKLMSADIHHPPDLWKIPDICNMLNMMTEKVRSKLLIRL